MPGGSGSGKLCHSGLLTNKNCYVEQGSWRRVCQSCLDDGEAVIPDERCWLLSQLVGNFSAGRTYYVHWTIDQKVIGTGVRPFPLAGTDAMLLIFSTEEAAASCARLAPQGLLVPAPPELRRLRMCSTSKSLCPHTNFQMAQGSSAIPTSCAIHLRAQIGAAFGGGGSARAQVAPVPMPSQQPVQVAAMAYVPPTSIACGNVACAPLSWAPRQPASSSMHAPLLSATGTATGTAPNSFPAARYGELAASHPSHAPVELHAAPPGLQHIRSRDEHQSRSSSSHVSNSPTHAGSSLVSNSPTHEFSIPSEEQQQAAAPDVPGYKRARTNDMEDHGGGGGGDGGIDELHRFFNSDDMLSLFSPLHCAGGPEQHPPDGQQPAAMGGGGVGGAGCTSPLTMSGGDGALPSSQHLPLGHLPSAHQRVGSAVPDFSVHGRREANDVDFGAADVRGTLFAHGQTLKASGSSMWTVVSDARLKEVAGDFPLGVEAVMRLRPKIFRYNGLGGTVANGKMYVGLIAQEVPRELAPYCCLRAQVMLRPTDVALTEILMLDHSSFPFLCVNALQEHEERLSAVEHALGGAAALRARNEDDLLGWVTGWMLPGLVMVASVLALGLSEVTWGDAFSTALAATVAKALTALWAALMVLRWAVGSRVAARTACVLLVLQAAVWVMQVGLVAPPPTLTSPTSPRRGQQAALGMLPPPRPFADLLERIGAIGSTLLERVVTDGSS